MKILVLSIAFTVFVLFVAGSSFNAGVNRGREDKCNPSSQFELGFTLGKMFVAQPVKVELTKGSYMRGVIFHGPVEIIHAYDAFIYNCDFECVTDDSYNVTVPRAWGEYGAAAIYWSDPDPKGELHITGGSITGRRP